MCGATGPGIDSVVDQGGGRNLHPSGVLDRIREGAGIGLDNDEEDDRLVFDLLKDDRSVMGCYMGLKRERDPVEVQCSHFSGESSDWDLSCYQALYELKLQAVELHYFPPKHFFC